MIQLYYMHMQNIPSSIICVSHTTQRSMLHNSIKNLFIYVSIDIEMGLQ